MGFSPFPQREQTMRRRLLRYMLVLTAIVLGAVLAGFSLMGRFHNDRNDLRDTLVMQMNFWEKDLTAGSDSLAAMGISLSETLSEHTEAVLDSHGISFAALAENDEAQTDLQMELLPLLRDYLLRADASGAYVLLDTSVHAGSSTRCGIYLQRKTMEPSDNSLLLYRGKANVAKNYGIVLHRKWRLELDTALFGRPDPQSALEDFPQEEEYRYTPVFTLPGTSEQAILQQVPIRAGDGSLVGICGFEISQTFFKQHSQPAIWPHLIFLLTTQDADGSLSANKLASGTTSNYFYNPAGPLTVSVGDNSLRKFDSASHSFLGLERTVSLGPGSMPIALVVMLPQEEYNHIILESILQLLFLFALLMIFAVSCCVFFSKSYLLPILRGLDRLKTKELIQESGVREIDDLFGVLLSEDQAHEAALRILKDEKNDAQSRAAQIQQEYDKIRQDYEASRTGRLQISQLQEIDLNSSQYEAFQRGLSELTATERKIVQYYFEGKTVKDIQALLDIKETTLRYHNRNIYSKLGVHSMKQLLQFALYTSRQKTHPAI